MSETPSRRANESPWNAVAECRRLVFCALASLPARQRSHLASVITSELRSAGLLGPRVEAHYSAPQAGLLLAGRCARWAAKAATEGKFGQCFRDGHGWLIPASGLELYLAARAVESSTALKKAAPATGEIAGKRVCKRAGLAGARARTAMGHFADRADAGSTESARKSLVVNGSRNGAAESGHGPGQGEREEGGGIAAARVATGSDGCA